MRAEVMINVADVEASSRWYQELLGCTSGHGGPDFEMLMDGKTLMLMLHRRGNHDHPSEPKEGDTIGSGVCIYIRVSDVHAVAAKATQMGVAHKGVEKNPLAHQEELEVRDPDGYFLSIAGPAEWAEPV